VLLLNRWSVSISRYKLEGQLNEYFGIFLCLKISSHADKLGLLQTYQTKLMKFPTRDHWLFDEIWLARNLKLITSWNG